MVKKCCSSKWKKSASELWLEKVLFKITKMYNWITLVCCEWPWGRFLWAGKTKTFKNTVKIPKFMLSVMFSKAIQWAGMKSLPFWFWSKHCRLCSWLTPINKTESKTSPNKFPNQESGHSKNVQPKGNHWWCGFLLAGHSVRSHVHTPRSQGRYTFHWVLKKVHYYSHHPLNRGFTCYTKVHSSHFKDYCTLILP